MSHPTLPIHFCSQQSQQFAPLGRCDSPIPTIWKPIESAIAAVHQERCASTLPLAEQRWIEEVSRKKRRVDDYTESDSRIGKWQGGALNLSQAQPASKQLNLKGWAMQTLPWGVHPDLKFNGCPTLPEPILESRAVYTDRASSVASSVFSRADTATPSSCYFSPITPVTPSDEMKD